jgi:hypothetical protein
MAHKHSEGSPCECEKLKNAEREELREGLKKCTEAREADRRAREEETAARAEEAEAEVKSLKKKLMAFQLATAVGTVVLGQEAVDKITAKMNAVTEVQHKITGEGGDKKDKPAAAPQASTTQFGQPWSKPWVQQKPFSDRNTLTQSGGDISGVFAGQYESQPVLFAPDVPESASLIPPSLVQAVTKSSSSPSLLPLNFTVTEQAFDSHSAFLTPSTLPFDVYSTTLGLGNNYGIGEYYGMNTGGAIVPTVPSPSPFAVFAMGGLVHSHGRRRA